MSDARITETIDRLAGRLRPVRPLRPPLQRAAGWLAVLAAVALAAYLVLDGDGSALTRGAFVLPAFLSAVITAAIAAFAAFELSLPDRSDRWVLAPLPPLVLWVAFSGLGCLADLGDPEAWGTTWPEVQECLLVILFSSIPLAVALVAMLRRAAPDRATPVAIVGGLAAAAGAGAILLLVHPHNSTILDLIVHGSCVAVVVGANALLGGRLLRRTRLRERA